VTLGIPPMEITTDIAGVVRSVLASKFRFYEHTLPGRDGYEGCHFLVAFPYDPRVRTEFLYFIDIDEYPDGSRWLRFRAENSHFHQPEKRAFLVEMAQSYHFEHLVPKVVVREGNGVMKTYTEANHAVGSGIAPGIFENWMQRFMAANFHYLQWLEDTDHGHRIPAAPPAAD